MKSSYTPGPWAFTKPVAGKRLIHTVEEYSTGSIFWKIALVWQRTSTQAIIEDLANAQLIACAPELLEQLEALLEFVEADRPGALIVLETQKLISKARGAK